MPLHLHASIGKDVSTDVYTPFPVKAASIGLRSNTTFTVWSHWLSCPRLTTSTYPTIKAGASSLANRHLPPSNTQVFTGFKFVK